MSLQVNRTVRHIHATLRQPMTRLCMALLLASGLSACVVSPYNNQFVTSNNPVYFGGFAQNPGAQIDILALNKKTNVWNVVANATVDTQTNVYNGNTLYQWQTNLTFNTLPEWQCYFNATCALYEGANEVLVKVHEVGGALTSLFTFDDIGLPCIEDQVNNGVGAFTAGWRCQSSDNPILHLKILNVN
jgi:hypothetical protein